MREKVEIVKRLHSESDTVTVRKGETCRIESEKHVVVLRNVQGISVVATGYFRHPRLRFERYYPPGTLKGQGEPLYRFTIDLDQITVCGEYICVSYFAVELGGHRYLASVSGGSNPDLEDRRPVSWGEGYIEVMHKTPRGWSGRFGPQHLSQLLAALGSTERLVRDDEAAAAVAEAYAAEQARLQAERAANVPLGLVSAAVACPDGRTFVWTTRGNYYLPPGVYSEQWRAGLVPGQSMTIHALRERGIVCEPTTEERPESVYGRRA